MVAQHMLLTNVVRGNTRTCVNTSTLNTMPIVSSDSTNVTMLIGRSAEASGIEVLMPLAAEIGWVVLWVPLTDGWLATVLVVVASIAKAGVDASRRRSMEINCRTGLPNVKWHRPSAEAAESH